MKYLWKSINLNSVFLSIHHSKNHYSMKWRSFTFTLSIWEANGITCWCHLNYKSNGKWYDWVMVWIFKENWWIIWAFISIKRHWTSKRCLFIIFQKIKMMCLWEQKAQKSGLNTLMKIASDTTTKEGVWALTTYLSCDARSTKWWWNHFSCLILQSCVTWHASHLALFWKDKKLFNSSNVESLLNDWIYQLK